MAALEAEVKKFVQLLEAKKIKDAKLYLDKIDQDDPDFQTQQIIAKGLQRCLVHKKTTPMGVTSALYIYKQLFVRALFDFMETQAFDQKVHKFVYDTCLYNSSLPIEKRGQSYFKQTMNVDQCQTIGCTLVSLALQLMQCMANWYPIDPQYNEPSIFARYYEKLKEKKVTFPTTYQVMKPEEEKKFKAKYQMWLDRLERQMSQEEQQQKKQQKKPTNDQKNPIKNEQVTSKVNQQQISKQPLNKNDKVTSSKINQQLQDQKKIQQPKVKAEFILDSSIGEKKKQNGESNKKIDVSKVNDPKKSQYIGDPKQKEQYRPEDAPFILEEPKQKPQSVPQYVPKEEPKRASQVPKIEDPKKKAEVISKLDEPKRKPEVISKLDEPKKKPQTSKYEEPKNRPQVSRLQKPQQNQECNFSNSQIFKYSRVKEENNNMPRRVQRKMQLPTSAPKKSLSPHTEFGKLQIAKMNEGIKKAKQQSLRKSAIRQINTSSVINSRIAAKTDYIGESQVSRYETPRRSSEHDSKRTPIKRIQSDLEDQNYKQKQKQKQKQFKQKQQRQRSQKQIISKEKEQKSPNKKFYKTENRQIFQNFGNEYKKKRSLPKTQRKNSGMPDNLMGAFLNRSPNIKRNIVTDQKTLSDFRNVKNKRRAANPYIQDYYSREPLLQKIDKLRIKQQVIRFIPQYFDPISTQWSCLLSESLKINSSTEAQPSQPFLRNNQVELQVIKLPHYYTLKIKNLRNKIIKIGFSQALQAKFGNQFSCRIKIIDSERKRVQQVTVWEAEPNQYADIHFNFSTNDANFKFLLIVLAIQEKINSFYLPITLLDQGVIQKYIDMQEVNQFIDFYGVIFKSTPILLSLRDQAHSYMSLPNFMSKNSNMNSQIIGYMTFQIPLTETISSKINIFIKKCDRYPNLYEIHSLTDKRREQNIDFSKVLIELLCFLLTKDQ